MKMRQREVHAVTRMPFIHSNVLTNENSRTLLYTAMEITLLYTAVAVYSPVYGTAVIFPAYTSTCFRLDCVHQFPENMKSPGHFSTAYLIPLQQHYVFGEWFFSNVAVLLAFSIWEFTPFNKLPIFCEILDFISCLCVHVSWTTTTIPVFRHISNLVSWEEFPLMRYINIFMSSIFENPVI